MSTTEHDAPHARGRVWLEEMGECNSSPREVGATGHEGTEGAEDKSAKEKGVPGEGLRMDTGNSPKPIPSTALLKGAIKEVGK